MSRYTPGPWEEGHFTGDIFAGIAGDNGKRIAAITGAASGLVTVEEAEANTCLIAAAPDILRELEKAKLVIQILHDEIDRRGCHEKIQWPTLHYDSRRAVLAKAGGHG